MREFVTDPTALTEIEALIEDKRTRCHAPMASEEASHTGGDPLDDYHDAAMDGVSCTLRHQIADNALGTSVSFNDHFTILDVIDPYDRPAYGPYVSQTLKRTAVSV